MRRGRAGGGDVSASGSATTWRRRAPTIDARALGEATLVVIGGNVRAALEARAAALGRELGPADVERITWMRAADGRATTAADYARSIGVMHRAGRVVARFFTGYDVLLSPTMCRPPHPLGVIDMMTDDVERYTKAVLGTIAFTSLFNSSGNPAMSVPLAWSQAGLPLGVQFAATYGDEATLLRLAAQLEAAQPWAEPPPATGMRANEPMTRARGAPGGAAARWPTRGREPPLRAPRHPPAPRRAGAIRTTRSASRCPPSS